MEVQKFDPKAQVKNTEVEDQEDTVVHDKCGTPECCGKCDTASTGEDG